MGTPDVASELDWEHVYDVHAPRLRRLIRRKVEAATIDDVLQETFLRAFKSRHTIDRTRPMKPWLNTIALRTIADVQRGADRTVETLDVDTECDELALACDALDEELSTRAKQLGIKHAFASLNSRHRRLLQLVDIEGMPYEYVARHEHMTIDAVKAALARARSNFRASYVIFTEKSGLFGAGALVGSMTLKLRLRLQRYQDFVTHHAAGVGAATLTVAVVAAATIPSTRPTATHAYGRGAKLSTGFLIGATEPATTSAPLPTTENPLHHSEVAPKPGPEATTTSPIRTAAQADITRNDDSDRVVITAQTTAPGADRQTWAFIEVECTAGVLAETKCDLVSMLPPAP